MPSVCAGCDRLVGSSHRWDCGQRNRRGGSVLVQPRDTTKTRCSREFRVVRPDGSVLLTQWVTVYGVNTQPFVHWQGRGDGRLDVQDPERNLILPPWRVEVRDEDGDTWELLQSSDPTEIRL